MVIIVIMILVMGVMVLVITISIFGTHFGSLYHTIPFIVTLVIMLMMPPRTPQDLEKLKPFGTLWHSPANCDNINPSHCRPPTTFFLLYNCMS